MSVTLDQVHKFHDEIRAGRITRDSLQLFLENPNRFREDLGRWGQYYGVEVDNGLTLEQMVAAAKFDGYVNQDYKNFKLTHKGKRVVSNLELASFDETVTGLVAAKRLEADGYVLEDIGALLAFAVKYPNEQRKRPIVALGSPWQDRGVGVLVPYLCFGGSARGLRLGWLGHDFHPDCLFLVSRKSPA